MASILLERRKELTNIYIPAISLEYVRVTMKGGEFRSDIGLYLHLRHVGETLKQPGHLAVLAAEIKEFEKGTEKIYYNLP